VYPPYAENRWTRCLKELFTRYSFESEEGISKENEAAITQYRPSIVRPQRWSSEERDATASNSAKGYHGTYGTEGQTGGFICFKLSMLTQSQGPFASPMGPSQQFSIPEEFQSFIQDQVQRAVMMGITMGMNGMVGMVGMVGMGGMGGMAEWS